MAVVQGWNVLHLNTVPLEIHSVILKMFQPIQKGYLRACRAWTEKQTHEESTNTHSSTWSFTAKQVQPTTYCAEPRKAKHTTFIRVRENPHQNHCQAKGQKEHHWLHTCWARHRPGFTTKHVRMAKTENVDYGWDIFQRADRPFASILSTHPFIRKIVSCVKPF